MYRNLLSRVILTAISVAVARPAAAQLVNGDFETGDLTGWSSFLTPNGTIRAGFPIVTPFDTTGSGVSNAMKIRIGQIAFVPGTPAGGGIQQDFVLANPGDFTASMDVAAALEQNFGNTQPGKFELLIDGQVLDVADFNGQTILPGDVFRGSLSGQANGLAAGMHTLQVRITRASLDTREVYQYVDNVTLAAVGGCAMLGDINGDGRTDGADIAGYIRVKLGSPAPGDNLACADYGTGSVAGDTAAFVADLLN